MKLTKTNKVVIIIIAALILLSAVCSVIIHHLGNAEPDRLSETEIASRREQFPVIPASSHPTIDFIHPTLEQIIEDCAHPPDENYQVCFVYGTIVGAVDIGDTSELSLPHKCTIEVNTSTGRLFKAEELITLRLSQLFWGADPPLFDGETVVLPVYCDKTADGGCSSFFTGTYYVTDDGYVLSMFDEDFFSAQQLSGLKSETFMAEIEKQIKKS